MFVRNLCTNENGRAVVKSINEITHFIVCYAVIEFIENEEILGVDYIPESGLGQQMGLVWLNTPGLVVG